jgi:hypothetical protein
MNVVVAGRVSPVGSGPLLAGCAVVDPDGVVVVCPPPVAWANATPTLANDTTIATTTRFHIRNRLP